MTQDVYEAAEAVAQWASKLGQDVGYYIVREELIDALRAALEREVEE